jgi:hypothetical protein
MLIDAIELLGVLALLAVILAYVQEVYDRACLAILAKRLERQQGGHADGKK